MKPILKVFASLRLTVVLLALAMVLIFVGTIAQTKLGVWQAVDSYFRSWIAMVDLSLFLPQSGSGVHIPIPGGLTIAGAMIINLLAAHVIRFKATRKRIGIVVLHSGMIVLLGGEFVTGFFADEGLMSIDEGSSSSYLEDAREVELAVIDPNDPEQDRVVSIPGWMIADASKHGRSVSDDRLPFDIQVNSWMANAQLFQAVEPTPATEGIGLEARADQAPQVSGVDGAQSDTPAAYITLSNNEETLGTWMVSAALIDPQRVDIDGSHFGVSLRYRRTYLPFEIHLNDFKHDIFTGTNIAKNFSSDVQLIDPENGTDREVRIWMNNPLRYAGLTFYQASYKPDGSGTVLQVVRNPGWLLPYLACILVSGGMLLHFGMSLTAFLKRRAKHGPVKTCKDHAQIHPKLRAWPWLVGVLGLVIACSGLFRPQASTQYDIGTFAQFPVSSGGRIKPMDTAARSMLMFAGGRQQIKTSESTTSAAEYLLNMVANPEAVTDLPTIRVDHPDVLALIQRSPDGGGRVALSAIQPHWNLITDQARTASGLDSRSRDGFQTAVLELHNKVNTVLAHAQMREPFAIPPVTPDGAWRPFHEAFLDEQGSDSPHPSVAFIATMLTAAGEDDPETFNKAAKSYTQLLEASMPDVMRRMRLEILFNKASLFTGTTAVYLLAFLGVCSSFIVGARAGSSKLAESLRVGSLALLISAVLIHTAAIALRIYLQDRPPVTNLYSSAVFVGWAAALAGIFMERLFPLGIAILGSATIGAGTLIIAHNLGNDGDTMQMMQAVLDSNFWLATHVITITLGYSATFLAGTIAALYLLASVCTRWITPERERTLIRMVYGIVCFAMLLSFVGTVLGGIWADQSWGRFWGWDPKENGAALVVLINAIILHARWGGLVRAKGIAALAVAGNIVTAWSWFGTNMLGVGLHAYGFMNSASFWLTLFIVTQVVLIVLAALLTRSPSR